VRGVSGLLKPETVQVSPLDACDVPRNPSFSQGRLLSDEVDTRASICASWANPESMAVIAPPSTPVRRVLGDCGESVLDAIMGASAHSQAGAGLLRAFGAAAVT